MLMKTFIFVDRSGTELESLTRDTCTALLPVAGKAVVDYAVEDLARAGIREAVIVACAHADKVEAHLGNGERWGMNFEYFPSRGAEHPAKLLQRYAKQFDAPCLLVRGDVLRSSVSTFIDRHSSKPGALMEAHIDGAPAGVCLFQGASRLLETLSWPYADNAGQASPAGVMDLPGAVWSALESPAAYHRANLDAAAGRYPGIRLAGWSRDNGLTVGRGSQVATPSLIGEHAFVGSGCRVHPQARLAGTSVIGDGCFIDSKANITDSVILPGSYVGENIEIRNAIVDGDRVLRIDSGASYRVSDHFLLAQMRQPGDSLIAGMTNRAAGLILLLASLPLWPMAALGALLQSPTAPLRPVRLRSNKYHLDTSNEPVRGEFETREWAVKAPLLRHLPLLLAVLAGHIKLVGNRPRAVDESAAGDTPWERVAQDTPAGLLGPVQLDLANDAPAEESMLNEIHYARYRNLRSDLKYLLKGACAMFSCRAWSARGQTESS
jgi:NDP-sugar pyrophosphorylase family protein